MKYFADLKQYVKEHSCKTCIVRCDLNLPSDTEDLTRVYAIRDTVLEVLDLGLKVVLISHYKRPKPDDINNTKFSLSNIVDKVSKVLNTPVTFLNEPIFKINKNSIKDPVTLLENLRFYPGETKNDEVLAKALARLGNVYINEAFSVCHRAHASVVAITKYIPSFIGHSLQYEIEGLTKVTNNIQRPYTAIIGGSKVSTKIEVLKQLSNIADNLVIAGAMANTFMVAKGINMQKSLFEQEQVLEAKNIMENSKATIILPLDFLASVDININGQNYEVLPEGYSAFDIGENSVKQIINVLSNTKTILWNGALGAFEFCNFNKSSKVLSEYISQLTKKLGVVSVIGGGETVASITKYKDDMSFVSTAGGAFLEYIAGCKLPGLRALGYY